MREYVTHLDLCRRQILRDLNKEEDINQIMELLTVFFMIRCRKFKFNSVLRRLRIPESRRLCT